VDDRHAYPDPIDDRSMDLAQWPEDDLWTPAHDAVFADVTRADGRHLPAVLRHADTRRGRITRGRLRGPAYDRPFRDTYVPAPAGPDAILVAALAGMPPGTALSHATAAALWDLPLPTGVDGTAPVHVTLGRGRARRHQTGLVIHTGRMAADDLGARRGMAVTSAARTWLDAVAEMSFVDAVALTDALLHQRHATVAELARAASMPGRRGVRRARAALSAADERAESRWETATRLLLLDAGIPVIPQVVVRDDVGFVARVDLAVRGRKAAVEFDGGHHAEPAQRRRDLRRDHRLRRAGWLVLPYSAVDIVRHPERVVADVRRAAAEAPRREE